MRVIFIRHGLTGGNLLRRYIGITDEPLCEEGIQQISGVKYPDCDKVIASPLKRCIQTAEIIYPDRKINICNDLRECNFGEFEGKNYIELAENPHYQRWIDSGGKMDFPKGESTSLFRKRCCRAFEKIMANNVDSVIAFVVHGGTIMSVFEKYAGGEFYDYHIANGRGYITEFDGKLRIVDKI